ncbi:tau 95 subunit of transcription factor TFIIIC [Knufia fluminis]|uniref:Tau 95 subunit of transcription factor TFIIIC n=1 Tax=Knufia fluminis TaxID=191047 RepID=A0AAN8EAK6_9EURO|nr:tau 95 subunit of transcription factor TFIIIC [Knufia fluminis]
MPTDTARSQPTNAPWLSIPAGQAISVEHPCMIKNVDKAIDMIGGATAISQALEEDSDKTFAISFRPNDPAARTVIANKKNATNVLLQISVPRRTGRKRKRGSNDPWIEDQSTEPPKKDATYMVRAMADNPAKYNVTAISGISSMHIWRSMPDFAYSTSQIRLLEDVKSKVLSQHYPTIKEFKLPQTYGLQDTTTLPPPTWSNQSIPQNYTYRQNPSVKVVSDPTTGQRIVRNTQAAPKIYSYQLQWDSPEYPTTPMPGIPPLAEQSQVFQATVAAIDALFQDRPIWTRRALLNRLESRLSSFNVVRFCIAYVAYAVRSGPWRDAYIRLGVDPRTDPKYRIYQSFMLQLVPRNNQGVLAPGANARKLRSKDDKDKEETAPQVNATPMQPSKTKVLENRHTYARFWSRSNDPTSHIFDGVSPLPPDGKVWQLCDVTDPQIAALRDLPEEKLRTVCENRYLGWYPNGTSAKIRVALKAKADALQNGAPLDPSLLEDFLKLPDQVGADVGSLNTEDSNKVVYTVGLGSHPEAVVTEPPLLQQAETTPNLTNTNEELSVYLSPNSTKQQLEWAAMYRGYARTGPSTKPPVARQGQGRSTKSKLMSKKSLLENQSVAEGVQQAIEGTEDLQTAYGYDPDQPIDVDMYAQIAEGFEDGPEVDDGEEILPSIEFNGFDVEDDDDELGLDLDPDIKLEEDVDTEQRGQEFFHGPTEAGDEQIEADNVTQEANV